MDARDAVRRLIRRMGYEVRQFTPLRSPTAARCALFERRGIDMVLDVGANAGQYGALLRRQGYTGRLVSLKPLAVLAKRGFRPLSLEPILLDDDGLLVELDGIFARR